ncbi:hypothetical protein SVIOM342S_08831 [Streptomyces violaceorubidus]
MRACRPPWLVAQFPSPLGVAPVPERGQLLDVVLGSEGLDRLVVRWASVAEDLQQLLEVALVVRGRAGLEEHLGRLARRVGEGVRAAGGHDDDRARGGAHHPVARTRLPLLPAVRRTDPRLEGEHVQLALEHVEQLLAAGVHMGSDVEPRRHDHLEGRRHARVRTGHLEGHVLGRRLHHPALTRRHKKALGRRHQAAHQVTGRASGPRISAPFLKGTSSGATASFSPGTRSRTASTSSSDSSRASMPPGQ